MKKRKIAKASPITDVVRAHIVRRLCGMSNKKLRTITDGTWDMCMNYPRSNMEKRREIAGRIADKLLANDEE